MDPFQSFLDSPAFIPPDDLSFADGELYPSEIDPYTRTRTSQIQQQLSWIEDSAKGCYLSAPPYSSSSNANVNATNTIQPFPTYNAGCFSDIDFAMDFPPPPPGSSSIAYSHSDRLPSPWTGHPPTPSGLDSPRSSAWGNIGCYMSPPYTDEVLIPSVEECGYPSPGALASVALPEVQIEPDHESVVQLDPGMSLDEPTFSFLDEAKDDAEPVGMVPQGSSVPEEDTPTIDRPDQSPKSPAARRVSRSSVDRVVKRRTSPSRRSLKSYHSRRTSSSSKPAAKQSKVSIAHGRQFVCSFIHYGCTSTFGSKNEWKRHISSQHLQLGFYRCDLDTCNVHSKSTTRDHYYHHHKKPRKSHRAAGVDDDAHGADRLANDFNRKDLFTQHLRRMHAPWVKEIRPIPSAKERETFEKSLEGVRERCWHQQRQPPVCSQCGFCGQGFSGEHGWDDRMEHVGRHFERDEALRPETEMEDVKLREWAIQEGIVQEVGGRWWLSSLCD